MAREQMCRLPTAKFAPIKKRAQSHSASELSQMCVYYITQHDAERERDRYTHNIEGLQPRLMWDCFLTPDAFLPVRPLESLTALATLGHFILFFDVSHIPVFSSAWASSCSPLILNSRASQLDTSNVQIRNEAD